MRTTRMRRRNPSRRCRTRQRRATSRRNPCLPAHRHAERVSASMNSDRREAGQRGVHRSEEHTSELQSLMRLSYAVFCLKKKELILTTHAAPPVKYTTAVIQSLHYTGVA